MDRAATPAIDQSGLILNFAPRKVPVLKPVPSKVKAATNHFCQRAVTSLEKSALIIPPEPLVSPLSDSPLAIRTIVPDKVRWDAQSYQQHSSSQANDSARLVNYLLGNAIVRYPLSRVCDVGCGTGQNLKSYQQAFHAEIYGADPSPTMCTQAQTTVAAEQMPIQCRGAEDFSFWHQLSLDPVDPRPALDRQTGNAQSLVKHSRPVNQRWYLCRCFCCLKDWLAF